MQSESWIIVELLILLAIFGGLAFFRIPAYEKGAWMVMGAIWTALSTILGYKFGRICLSRQPTRSQAKQPNRP